jgi:hypothetical protein
VKPLEIHANARICEETHEDYDGGYSTLVVQVKRDESWEEVGHFCVVEDVEREAQILRRPFVAVAEEAPDIMVPVCFGDDAGVIAQAREATIRALLMDYKPDMPGQLWKILRILDPDLAARAGGVDWEAILEGALSEGARP